MPSKRRTRTSSHLLAGIPAPFPKALGGNRMSHALVRLNDFLIRLSKGLFAYQIIIVAARKCGIQTEALNARLPRVGEVPFSSERKLMSTMHRDKERDDRLVVFTKGAPDVLIARCPWELVGNDPRPLTPELRSRPDADSGAPLRTPRDPVGGRPPNRRYAGFLRRTHAFTSPASARPVGASS